MWLAPSEDELFALGFSRRKAEYVIGLARAELDFAELAALPDDEVKERITAIRGLGEWTADWFLARHLARPRAWAPGDLGVRKAVAAFYGDADMHVVVARFDPFQNLSVHYLLTGLGRDRLVQPVCRHPFEQEPCGQVVPPVVHVDAV